MVDVEERRPEAMDVKDRKPYRSLTRRRDAERRYTSSSADSEEGKAPQKSYSSSETLKAYDQDARLPYGSRVKDMVPQEAEEFCRAGEGRALHTCRGAGETKSLLCWHRNVVNAWPAVHSFEGHLCSCSATRHSKMARSWTAVSGHLESDCPLSTGPRVSDEDVIR